VDYLKTLIPENLQNYFLKYRFGKRDRYGNRVRVLIYERDGDTTIDVTDLKGLSPNSLVLQHSFEEGDFFRPLAGSQLTINVVPDTINQLSDFSICDETKYLVELYEDYGSSNSRMTFSGYISPETYSQSLRNPNAPVSITAVDALRLLGNIPFEPSVVANGIGSNDKSPLPGEHQLKYVIAYLLAQIGNRYDIANLVPYEWVSSGGVIGKRLWDRPVHLINYFGKSCLDVMRDICDRFKMQVLVMPVTYHSGWTTCFAFRLIDDALTQMHEWGERYDRFGVWQGSFGKAGFESFFPAKVLSVNNDMDVLPGTRMSAESAIKKLEITTESVAVKNLLWNGDFKHELLGWYVFDGISANVLSYSKHLNAISFPATTGLSTDPWGVETPADAKKINFDIRAVKHYANSFVLEFQVMRIIPPFTNITGFNLYVEIYGDGSALKESIRVEDDNESNRWTYVKHVFEKEEFVNSANIVERFSVYAPNTETLGVVIKDVRLYISDTNFNGEPEEVQDISNNEEYLLREKSFQTATETIQKDQGDIYRFNDLVVMQPFGISLSPAFSVKFIKRRNTSTSYPIDEMIRNHIRDYYARNRRKITIAVIPDDGVFISSMTLIQLPAIGSTFAINSMTRNIHERVTRIEMMEYLPYIIFPDIEINEKWILFNASWNDTNQWFDNEQWKDSN